MIKHEPHWFQKNPFSFRIPNFYFSWGLILSLFSSEFRDMTKNLLSYFLTWLVISVQSCIDLFQNIDLFLQNLLKRNHDLFLRIEFKLNFFLIWYVHPDPFTSSDIVHLQRSWFFFCRLDLSLLFRFSSEMSSRLDYSVGEWVNTSCALFRFTQIPRFFFWLRILMS